MKPKSKIRSSLFACGSLLAISYVHAQNGTWGGTAVPAAGTTSSNWTDINMWTGGTIADGADFNANFTGIDIAGAKTVSLNGVDRTIGNITFTDATTANNNLTISGNILTLDRTDATKPNINVTNQTLTISSQISGNDGLQKIGAGTLILSGSNNFTGGLELNAGTLQGQVVGTSLAPVSPLGAGAVAVNGGTLQLRASGTLNTTAETITFGNNVTVGGNATINVDRPGATSTNKRILLGTLGIGASTLTVTGANTYGLSFGATTASGATIFTNNNAGNTGSSVYGLALGSLTLANSVTTDTTTTITVGGTGGSTSIGAITNNSVDSTKRLALSKSGSGRLDLTAAGNYSGGTTVSGGSIIVGASNAFGTGAITITENSTIEPGYGAYPILNNDLQVNATKTLTSGGSTQYFGITYTGVVSGSGTISVVGGNNANTRNRLELTNASNTFTGDMLLGGGSAIINVNSLGDAGKIQLSANNVTGGFALGAGTATSLLFNTRQIELAGSSALYNNNDTGKTFTVNTNLAFSGAGTRTLTPVAATQVRTPSAASSATTEQVQSASPKMEQAPGRFPAPIPTAALRPCRRSAEAGWSSKAASRSHPTPRSPLRSPPRPSQTSASSMTALAPSTSTARSLSAARTPHRCSVFSLVTTIRPIRATAVVPPLAARSRSETSPSPRPLRTQIPQAST